VHTVRNGKLIATEVYFAKEFYGTTLGIPFEEHMPGMMTLKTKGANVNVLLKKTSCTRHIYYSQLSSG
jgi:hypothetical protein